LLNPHQLPAHFGKFYRRQFEWSVGHPTEMGSFGGTSDFRGRGVLK
jgi:hypothetical protein